MSANEKRAAFLAECIIRDPQICGGEPVFKGTRVPSRTVLASLADGNTMAAQGHRAECCFRPVITRHTQAR